VREAFFSDEYYGLVWGKRVGFAKVAVEAKVVSLSRRFSHWLVTCETLEV
jgi:hypothetical protein